MSKRMSATRALKVASLEDMIKLDGLVNCG